MKHRRAPPSAHSGYKKKVLTRFRFAPSSVFRSVNIYLAIHSYGRSPHATITPGLPKTHPSASVVGDVSRAFAIRKVKARFPRHEPIGNSNEVPPRTEKDTPKTSETYQAKYCFNSDRQFGVTSRHCQKRSGCILRKAEWNDKDRAWVAKVNSTQKTDLRALLAEVDAILEKGKGDQK